jgi:hypothetical protein
LCTHHEDHIPPLMGEIGAWLAAQKIEFVRVGC